MVVHKFSNNLINSGLFKTFQAAGFFATIIFFVVNSDIFSPIEMILGVILATIFFQGLNNLMFSFLLKYFTFEEMNKEFGKRYNEEQINNSFQKLEVRTNKENLEEIEQANSLLEEKLENNDIIGKKSQIQQDDKIS